MKFKFFSILISNTVNINRLTLDESFWDSSAIFKSPQTHRSESYWLAVERVDTGDRPASCFRHVTWREART